MNQEQRDEPHIEGKHLFTSDQKLEWFGNGEWVEEPDLVEFEHKGIDCIAKRIVVKEWDCSMHMGYLCGYVKLPENHPWTDLDYNDIDVDAYQGLTYKEQQENGIWIGFDCAHCMDITPSMELMRQKNKDAWYIKDMEDMKNQFPNCVLFNRTYKNMNFVIEKCKSLAEQVNNSLVINDQ